MYEFDDVGIGCPAILTGFILLHAQMRMIATLPMDDELDLVGDDVHHNLFDQQAEYLLARFSARPNTVPSRWKIPSEFKEPFAIFRSDYVIGSVLH